LLHNDDLFACGLRWLCAQRATVTLYAATCRGRSSYSKAAQYEYIKAWQKQVCKAKLWLRCIELLPHTARYVACYGQLGAGSQGFSLRPSKPASRPFSAPQLVSHVPGIGNVYLYAACLHYRALCRLARSPCFVCVP